MSAYKITWEQAKNAVKSYRVWGKDYKEEYLNRILYFPEEIIYKEESEVSKIMNSTMLNSSLSHYPEVHHIKSSHFGISFEFISLLQVDSGERPRCMSDEDYQACKTELEKADKEDSEWRESFCFEFVGNEDRLNEFLNLSG